MPRDQQERRFTILAGVMDPDHKKEVAFFLYSREQGEIDLVPG